MDIAITILGLIATVLLAVFAEPIAAWWRKRQAEKNSRPKEAEKPEKCSDDAKNCVTQSSSPERPICHCSKDGEVMLLKMYGLTGKYIYECSKCKRRINADVPDQLY